MITALYVSAALAAPTWADIAATTAWTTDSTVDTSDAGKVEISTATIGGVSCFRAVATTDATVEALAATVMDVPGTIRWSTAGVTEAENLSKGATAFDYYQYLDVPGWTMSSDRFWFLHGTLTKEASGTMFRWERLIDGGAYAEKYKAVKAAHPDAIEPPVNVGGWLFTGAAPTTKITYSLCTDSGGSIPQFVQTAATRRTLPDTLSDAVREAKKRK